MGVDIGFFIATARRTSCFPGSDGESLCPDGSTVMVVDASNIVTATPPVDPTFLTRTGKVFDSRRRAQWPATSVRAVHRQRQGQNGMKSESDGTTP
jgi:hypothetical protein